MPKKLFALALVLASLSYHHLSGQDQSTFTLDWHLEPRQSFAGKNSVIVFSYVQKAMRTFHLLSKFRPDSAGFSLEKQVILPDSIVDYRFHNEKLHVIAFQYWHCDFNPMNYWFYTIDTSDMNVSFDRADTIMTFTKAEFLNDSTYLLIGNFTHKAVSTDFSKSKDTLWGVTYDYFKSFPSGYFIFQKSDGKVRLGGLDPHSFPETPKLPPVKKAWHFSPDSFALYTGNRLYKIDTTMSPLTQIQLPPHQKFHFFNSTYYLINGSTVSFYNLATGQLLQQKTFSHPVAGLELHDVVITASDTLLLTFHERSSPVNELGIFTDFTPQLPAAQMHDLSLAAISVDSLKYLPQNLFRKRAYVSLQVKNNGPSTITDFSLLYEHRPRYEACSHKYIVQLEDSLAPGASAVVPLKIDYWNDSPYTCFYVSSPNTGQDVQFNNNKICTKIPLGSPEEALSSVAFYPNPADDFVNIDGDTDAVESAAAVDLKGVEHPLELVKNQGTLRFKTAHLAPGLYLLKIDSGTEIAHHKLLIQR